VAGFTNEEIDAAVDRYLTKQVSVSTTKTGSRDIRAARDLVYDLITSAILLRPDSFFYVVWLATNKLQALVRDQIAALEEIDAIAPLLARLSKRIQSTSELTNAKAAILEVNAGMNSRSQGVRGSIGPAVNRFRRSVTRFINDELTKNVLVGSTVTETSDELRVKLSTLWDKAIARHIEIVALNGNITTALSQLEQASLPRSSIQSILQKIETRIDELQSIMDGPTAVEQSRETMLDLLTMRTLLAKASSFRNPELLLAPLTGDSNLLNFLDSVGYEASQVAPVSGPYNYGVGTSLSISVNGSPYVLPFPDHSMAELRSVPLPVWADPPVTAEIAFTLDLTGSSGPYVTAGPYGSGPAAAAAFDAALAGVTVTWDAGTNQLVFRSDATSDVSSLYLLVNSPARLQFLSWAFPGLPYEARGVPQQASVLSSSLSSSTTLLDFPVETTPYAAFTGVRTLVVGEEAIVWNRLDAGTNLVADGTNVVTSPTKNFQGLGLRAGMAIKITAPAPSAGDYTIQLVSGSSMTLSAPVAATAVGVYYAGPDYRGVPDGARVQAASRISRDNSGFYRVAVGGGQIARIVLDRNVLVADGALNISVFAQYLRITSRGTTTSSGVGTLVPSAGATALGLTVAAAETPAELSTMEIVGSGDFLARGVRAGDHVYLTSPVPYVRTVASVEATRITFTAPVPYVGGSWTYYINSTRVEQYNTLSQGTSAFSNSTFVTGFSTLDNFVSRLLRGARYSSQISNAVSTYSNDLSALLSYLVAYTVPKERGIDNAIKTMREQGFDRAADLFLGLEISTFFSMDADGVSYSTWLVHQSAKVARNVAPVSKYAKSLMVRQEWRLLSFQNTQVDPLRTDLHNRQ
jgi:hypothetical protein